MNIFPQILTCLRVVIVTMLICSGLYSLTILVVGQALMPASANGSIIHGEHGEAVGSELIAQSFARPKYLWPRPSAVDYDAAATGGSNLSPAGEALRQRVEESIQRFNEANQPVIPADLVMASGSGLDPHITEQAALFQADRIAEARGLDRAVIENVIQSHAFRPGWALTDEPLVNILQINIDLDKTNR
ncbi:MAG: potassium-transporting ATPase subunit KdpC [bacterium]